jgi:hypothetical protein
MIFAAVDPFNAAVVVKINRNVASVFLTRVHRFNINAPADAELTAVGGGLVVAVYASLI